MEASARPAVTLFSVLESFGGISGEQVEIESDEHIGDCGFEFTIGETYLVFASRSERTLVVSGCTETRPAVSVAALVAQLRARAHGQRTATLSGLVAIRPPASFDYETVPVEPLRRVEVKAIGTAGEFSSVTNEYGVFEFNNLPPDRYEIRPALTSPLSSRENQQPHRFRIDAESSCVHNIWARWDGSISGRLVDARGNPVRGAVSLNYLEPRKLGDRTVESPTGMHVTGEDGLFSFTLLPPDRYRLIVTPSAGSNLDFARRQLHPETITLDRGQHTADIVVVVGDRNP